MATKRTLDPREEQERDEFHREMAPGIHLVRYGVALGGGMTLCGWFASRLPDHALVEDHEFLDVPTMDVCLKCAMKFKRSQESL